MTQVPAGLPLRAEKNLVKGRDAARCHLLNKTTELGFSTSAPYPHLCSQDKGESEVLSGY